MKLSHMAPIAVGAVALLLAGATTADARRPDVPRVTIVPDLESAYVCGDALWAAFNTVQQNDYHQRIIVQDDGKQDLQVLGVNGRYGPNGMWITVHNSAGSDNGGEGRKRVPMADITGKGIIFSKVRTIRTDRDGWTSVELRPIYECPAV